MQTALMECIRYIFPAGAQAWLPPAKTPRLACQQICDALGRNKHRHFCSFWPKLRRTISALYCFYMRDNAFLPIVLGNILNAHQKKHIHLHIYIHVTHIHITRKQNTFILFPSLFNGFLILMQVNYIAVEIRQHSSDKSNTCMSEPEH